MEIGSLEQDADVDQFRETVVFRLKDYAACDDIYLTHKMGAQAEVIFLSSKQGLQNSFTTTDFLQGENRSFYLHHDPKFPSRTHYLKDYATIVSIPLNERHYKGSLVLAWKAKNKMSDGFLVFLESCVFRIREIVRLNGVHLALEEIRVKFDAVFHSVSQALIFTDDSGKSTWVNSQAKQLLRIESDREVLEPTLVSEAMKQLRQRAENAQEIEKAAADLFSLPDATKVNWLWKYQNEVYRVASIPIASKRVRGRLWVYEDVSEIYFNSQMLQWYNNQLKEVNEEIKAAMSQLSEQNDLITQQNSDIKAQNKKLEDLNQEKDDLIGVVSHDLKTPLLQINGLANIIGSRAQEANNDQKVFLEKIQSVSQNGLSLIKDLLDLSSIEQKDITEKLIVLDAHDVLVDQMALFKSMAEKKKIQLQLTDKTTSFKMLAEPSYLKRILDNLISNAIKFSHSDTTVGLGVSNEHEHLLITVSDQGQGIKESDMPSLFGKFKKLSARPTANESSTGLGLSIVKALVEALKGEIHVKSEWGKGSTFSLRFKKV